ncbi:MAG TPA: hypothetical protein VIJ57_04950 [Hanamia sp.]
MTSILSYTEIIDQKKATELAIAKLLKELQEQTGAMVYGVNITKLVSPKDTEIKVYINLNY